jgi:hypothetical protein
MLVIVCEIMRLMENGCVEKRRSVRLIRCGAVCCTEDSNREDLVFRVLGIRSWGGIRGSRSVLR